MIKVELNERIGNDNWCVDAKGNVTRNGTRLCGPDGLDECVPIVRRLLAAWWAAQPPCKDPVVGEWHGHLVSRCHRCVHYYPRNRDWTCELEKEPATCGSRVEEPVARYTWEQAEAGMRRGEVWVGKLPTWSTAHSFRFNENNWEYWFFEIKSPEGWSSFFRVDLLKQCEWRGKETTDET